jgi:formylglycine-generating enzyme required for sulfatase activity
VRLPNGTTLSKTRHDGVFSEELPMAVSRRSISFGFGLAVLLGCGVLCNLALAQTSASSIVAIDGSKIQIKRALVIGNQRYRSIPVLRNASSDADAMARALKELGFAVTLHKDLDTGSMHRAIREFNSQLHMRSEAVFFYAGHGIQRETINFLLPIDTAATNESRLKSEAPTLQGILQGFSDRKARLTVAIIDACRDDPFESAGTRTLGSVRGLAPLEPAAGQIILYSAGSGQRALDYLSETDMDPNGVFTRVLLKHMKRPGLPVDQVLKRTREEVVALARAIGHQQVPALYDQSIGNFYFSPPADINSLSVDRLSAALPESNLPITNERVFWESVRDTTNPEELKAYLAKFPDGLYAYVALTRLRGLQDRPDVQTSTLQSTLSSPEHRRTASLSALRPGTTFRDCADCPEMVVIPPGRFTMGGHQVEDEKGRKIQLPDREVIIERPFAVGRFEVTRAQYAQFVRETGRSAISPNADDALLGVLEKVGMNLENPGNVCMVFSRLRQNWLTSFANKDAARIDTLHYREGERRWTDKGFVMYLPGNRGLPNWQSPGFAQTDDDPAVCISWNEAIAYTVWLGEKTDHNYRLLTEAEWEYVARAGTSTRFFWGDEIAEACRYANVADITRRGHQYFPSTFDCVDHHADTAPVGNYLPNAFGVHDMLGNVEEWVMDCWSDQYQEKDGNDPTSTMTGCDTDDADPKLITTVTTFGAATGLGPRRVVRGGSWYDGPDYLRSAARRPATQNEKWFPARFSIRGFRIARTD